MNKIENRRYSAASKRPPMIQLVCDESSGRSEGDGDSGEADMIVGPL